MTIDVPRPPERIETARLVLRVPRPEDAPVMFRRWASDAEVTRFLSWLPHTELRQSELHIERVRGWWVGDESFVWFLETRSGGEVIGSVAARRSHGVNLGYVLARDEWGKGYMTEAVRAVAEWYLAHDTVHRVWATCDPENVGSARVLEKAGFELEGRLRRWEDRPNSPAPGPHDALCYSRVSMSVE